MQNHTGQDAFRQRGSFYLSRHAPVNFVEEVDHELNVALTLSRLYAVGGHQHGELLAVRRQIESSPPDRRSPNPFRTTLAALRQKQLTLYGVTRHHDALVLRTVEQAGDSATISACSRPHSKPNFCPVVRECADIEFVFSALGVRIGQPLAVGR
jgi:hypothetical protein